MFNSSLAGKKPAIKKAAPVPKVNEQESKDIMNQLYDDLDQNEDALIEQRMVQIQPVQPLAFNKQEELSNKYAVAAPKVAESKPAANIFSKKRLIDEISKNVE